MEPDQIIERIGSDDNPPTVEELAAVKQELEAAQETLRASIKDKAAGHAPARLRSMTEDLANSDSHWSKVSGLWSMLRRRSRRLLPLSVARTTTQTTTTSPTRTATTRTRPWRRRFRLLLPCVPRL